MNTERSSWIACPKDIIKWTSEPKRKEPTETKLHIQVQILIQHLLKRRKTQKPNRREPKTFGREIRSAMRMDLRIIKTRNYHLRNRTRYYAGYKVEEETAADAADAATLVRRNDASRAEGI